MNHETNPFRGEMHYCISPTNPGTLSVGNRDVGTVARSCGVTLAVRVLNFCGEVVGFVAKVERSHDML